MVVIGGVERKIHFFVLDLPHSDGCYVRAYPAAVSEAWVDGHIHAFAFFRAEPQSIVYDNDRCLGAKIQPDGTHKRAAPFSGFLSHYLIRDRYERPGKGNDKGSVKGLVVSMWCGGRTLVEIEAWLLSFVRKHEGEVKQQANQSSTAQRARRFAIRIAPDLGFLCGVLGQIIAHKAAEGDDGTKLPVIDMLPQMVRAAVSGGCCTSKPRRALKPVV